MLRLYGFLFFLSIDCSIALHDALRRVYLLHLHVQNSQCNWYAWSHHVQNVSTVAFELPSYREFELSGYARKLFHLLYHYWMSRINWIPLDTMAFVIGLQNREAIFSTHLLIPFLLLPTFLLLPRDSEVFLLHSWLSRFLKAYACRKRESQKCIQLVSLFKQITL